MENHLINRLYSLNAFYPLESSSDHFTLLGSYLTILSPFETLTSIQGWIIHEEAKEEKLFLKLDNGDKLKINFLENEVEIECSFYRSICILKAKETPILTSNDYFNLSIPYEYGDKYSHFINNPCNFLKVEELSAQNFSNEKSEGKNFISSLKRRFEKREFSPFTRRKLPEKSREKRSSSFITHQLSEGSLSTVNHSSRIIFEFKKEENIYQIDWNSEKKEGFFKRKDCFNKECLETSHLDLSQVKIIHKIKRSYVYKNNDVKKKIEIKKESSDFKTLFLRYEKLWEKKKNDLSEILCWGKNTKTLDSLLANLSRSLVDNSMICQEEEKHNLLFAKDLKKFAAQYAKSAQLAGVKKIINFNSLLKEIVFEANEKVLISNNCRVKKNYIQLFDEMNRAVETMHNKDVVLFCGPSASGKSTLIAYLLSGYLLEEPQGDYEKGSEPSRHGLKLFPAGDDKAFLNYVETNNNGNLPLIGRKDDDFEIDIVRVYRGFLESQFLLAECPRLINNGKENIYGHLSIQQAVNVASSIRLVFVVSLVNIHEDQMTAPVIENAKSINEQFCKTFYTDNKDQAVKNENQKSLHILFTNKDRFASCNLAARQANSRLIIGTKFDGKIRDTKDEIERSIWTTFKDLCKRGEIDVINYKERKIINYEEGNIINGKEIDNKADLTREHFLRKWTQTIEGFNKGDYKNLTAANQECIIDIHKEIGPFVSKWIHNVLIPFSENFKLKIIQKRKQISSRNQLISKIKECSISAKKDEDRLSYLQKITNHQDKSEKKKLDSLGIFKENYLAHFTNKLKVLETMNESKLLKLEELKTIQEPLEAEYREVCEKLDSENKELKQLYLTQKECLLAGYSHETGTKSNVYHFPNLDETIQEAVTTKLGKIDKNKATKMTSLEPKHRLKTDANPSRRIINMPIQYIVNCVDIEDPQEKNKFEELLDKYNKKEEVVEKRKNFKTLTEVTICGSFFKLVPPDEVVLHYGEYLSYIVEFDWGWKDIEKKLTSSESIPSVGFYEKSYDYKTSTLTISYKKERARVLKKQSNEIAEELRAIQEKKANKDLDTEIENLCEELERVIQHLLDSSSEESKRIEESISFYKKKIEWKKELLQNIEAKLDDPHTNNKEALEREKEVIKLEKKLVRKIIDELNKQNEKIKNSFYVEEKTNKNLSLDERLSSLKKKSENLKKVIEKEVEELQKDCNFLLEQGKNFQAQWENKNNNPRNFLEANQEKETRIKEEEEFLKGKKSEEIKNDLEKLNEKKKFLELNVASNRGREKEIVDEIKKLTADYEKIEERRKLIAYNIFINVCKKEINSLIASISQRKKCIDVLNKEKLVEDIKLLQAQQQQLIVGRRNRALSIINNFENVKKVDKFLKNLNSIYSIYAKKQKLSAWDDLYKEVFQLLKNKFDENSITYKECFEYLEDINNLKTNSSLYELNEEMPLFSPPPHAGIDVGLRNFGLTCWANSVLKFIACSSCYDSIFTRDLSTTGDQRKNFQFLLGELIRRLRSSQRDNDETLRQFLSETKQLFPSLSEEQQNDAVEFFLQMLTTLEWDPYLHHDQKSNFPRLAINYELEGEWQKYPTIEDYQPHIDITLPNHLTDETLDLDCLLADEGVREVRPDYSLLGNEVINTVNMPFKTRTCLINAPRTLMVYLKRGIIVKGERVINTNPIKLKNNCISFASYGVQTIESNGRELVTNLVSQQPVFYKIGAAIVHRGNSLDSGHYTCYERAKNGDMLIHNDLVIGKCRSDDQFGVDGYFLRLDKVEEPVLLQELLDRSS